MLRELTLKLSKQSKKQNNRMTDVTETTPTNTVADVAPEVKRGPGRPKTKVTLKRVVLLNGEPVGKGRPAKEGKANRTVVYIPVEQTFDVNVHGLGVKYRADRAKLPLKRVDIAKFAKMVNTPQIKPAEVKAPAVEAVAPAA